MKRIALLLFLAACGKDPKIDQAKQEAEAIAANIAGQTKGEEGTMGPCLAPMMNGKPVQIDPSLPKNDPWGHPYTIECGNGYEVVSDGPDGKPGTKDDIRAGGRRNPLPP